MSDAREIADEILELRNGARLLRATAQLMRMPASAEGARVGLDLAAMATVEGSADWRDPKAKRPSL